MKQSTDYPGKSGPKKAPPIDRFWRHVRVVESGCWEWTGYIKPNGYGSFSAGGRNTTVRAHRFAYSVFIGPLPDGLVLDHLCGVRHCVNPAHLEAVTNAENLRRGKKPWSGRTHCNHGHELTPENTVRRADNGGVRCRICRREESRRRKAAARESRSR